MEEEITLAGSLAIQVDVNIKGTFEVAHADDDQAEFSECPSPYVHTPVIVGTGTLDVSAGTLTFKECYVDDQSSLTWALSEDGTIHVTEDCYSGTPAESAACDITLSGGELWIQRGESQSTFETDGSFTMTDGTLDVDGAFKVTGGLAWSGGTIEVANGKSAAFD